MPGIVADSPRRSLALAVMAVTPLFFSSNLVFGRAVIHEVSPFILAFLRWGAVAVLMLPFVDARALARQFRAHWPILTGLGFLGMFVCGGMVYAGLKLTTATNGTLIYTTSPVFIILIDAALNGRRTGLREMTGSLLAFAGVAAIVLEGDLRRLAALSFNPGDAVFVLAAIAWAAYAVFGRGLRGMGNRMQFALLAFSGALVLAPAAAVEAVNGGAWPQTAEAFAGLAGIVVIASLAAFLGFQFGVRELGAPLAGVFMYLLPPYGVALSVLFLGESLHPYHALGVALVMAGVILSTWPGRSR